MKFDIGVWRVRYDLLLALHIWLRHYLEVIDKDFVTSRGLFH